MIEERAPVHERDAGPVGELDDRPREPVERVGSRSDFPVSVHAKVHDQRVTVVEMEKLVLPAPLDGLDPLPLRGAGFRR